MNPVLPQLPGDIWRFLRGNVVKGTPRQCNQSRFLPFIPRGTLSSVLFPHLKKLSLPINVVWIPGLLWRRRSLLARTWIKFPGRLRRRLCAASILFRLSASSFLNLSRWRSRLKVQTHVTEVSYSLTFAFLSFMCPSRSATRPVESRLENTCRKFARNSLGGAKFCQMFVSRWRGNRN